MAPSTNPSRPIAPMIAGMAAAGWLFYRIRRNRRAQLSPPHVSLDSTAPSTDGARIEFTHNGNGSGGEPAAGAPGRRPETGDDGGHSAEKPSDIPKSGWWSVLKRVFADIGRKNLSIIAAGVSFYAMLSIFPALAAIVALYGFVADPATVQHQIAEIQGVIPGEARKLLLDQLQAIVTAPRAKLGLGLIVGLGVALWGARSGVVTLITALNIAYEEEEKRSLLRFQLAAMAMTLGTVVFAIVALTMIALVPALIGFLPFPEAWKTGVSLVRWPILGVLVAIGLAAVYRFAPARTKPKWRWVSWGASLATGLWILGSVAFSVYVSKFGNYDKTFGSLGAVVILLTWFYLSSFAVLMGASLNAELERQTARDTTREPERPMGRRGAKMADTVAQDP
jgi:membrane protein